MKRLFLALILALTLTGAQAFTTEPGGVVDQTSQSRGALGVVQAAIATGGVSQIGLTSNPFRKYVLIQNPSTATEALFVNFGLTASSATSVQLLPGQTWVFETLFLTTDQINIFAATTGHAYTIVAG